MKVKTCLVWYAVIGFSVWMGSAHADTVYLQDLLVEADSNNPSIIAARHQYEAAKSRVSGIRHLPDPLVGVEFTPDKRMYSITQPVQFPTKLTTLSSLARTEGEQYEYLYVNSIQNIHTDVKNTFAELYYSHRKIEVITESVGFLEQIYYIASQHYALGHAPQTHVLRAQIELAKAENELLAADDEKAVIEAQLNTLLNRNVSTQYREPHIETSVAIPEIQELQEMMKLNHPELSAAQRMVEKARIMRSIAKQTYLPDFLFKFTREEMDGTLTDQKFMFGFTIPVWFWGKQSTMVSEMSANQEMMESRYQVMENNLVFAVQNAKIDFDKKQRTLAVYENSIIPLGHANVQSALVAYETDQIDFFGLLETERAFVQFQLEQHRAQADLLRALAALEKAVGTERVER